MEKMSVLMVNQQLKLKKLKLLQTYNSDDTQLILWATLAITCGGIIIYLTSKIRRKEEK